MKWIPIAGLLLLLQIHMPVPESPTDNLTVTYHGQVVTSASRSDYSLIALPLVDPDKLEQWMDDLDSKVQQPPQNATIGNYGQIVPGQNGHKLDRGRVTDQFQAYFFGSGPAEFEVPLTETYPKVDSELLASIKEKPIGSYVTYFNARNKNRAHNIALAAQAINNTVLFPNETFSFNQTVGIRTQAKGYVQAPIIVRGELSEGIGGGICQVSSTLFNAIDRAGLKIVKRYSHSRHVRYVPPGRDATVSWGGPDFVFENQYNQPILIRTFVSGGSVYVTIYSSDVIEYKPRVVPSTIKCIPEEISDDTNVGNRSQP